MSRLRVLVVTFGDADTGSTHFRVGQYRPELEAAGLELTFVSKHDLPGLGGQALRGYDLLLNQKSLLPTGLARRLRRSVGRVLFDFDDAIYTRPGRDFSPLTRFRVRRRLAFWLRHADRVIAANSVLADYARRYCEPLLLPMALDLDEWHPADRTSQAPRSSGGIAIGWAGAPVNLRYLQAVEPALARLMRERDDVTLRILSGERPRLSIPFTHVPFERAAVPGFVRDLDIGLLPLEDDPFSRGKSPIKAIQYIASGVPVVADIHGATRDILEPGHAVAVHDGQWEAALRELIEQPERRAAMGGRARVFAERHFDRAKVAPRLLAAITGDEAKP